jgi:hypothetical protein
MYYVEFYIQRRDIQTPRNVIIMAKAKTSSVNAGLDYI